MTEVRTKLYTIRLSEAEDAIAKRVSEHLGLPLSSALRMLILEKGRELGVDAKPKTKPSK